MAVLGIGAEARGGSLQTQAGRPRMGGTQLHLCHRGPMGLRRLLFRLPMAVEGRLEAAAMGRPAAVWLGPLIRSVLAFRI